MDDQRGYQPDDKRPDGPKRPDGTEGVRIIGAEEAAEAIERGDVAQRRPDDVPRYGDRPTPPPDDGPRPAIRFPLSNRTEPEAVERAQLVPPDPVLPHWTEPPTGEVPRIFATDEPDDDLDAWSSFSGNSPRWRGEGNDYADDFDDIAALGDDQTRVGALDSRSRPEPDDFFAFDEEEAEPAASPSTRTISSAPRRTTIRPTGRTGPVENGTPPGRDVPTAIGVGVGFAVVALILFKLGPKYAMGLVVVVLGLAALELFNGLRKAGFQPATLLGAAATVSFTLAVYAKGEAAFPLVLFLTVVFGLLWYWWVSPDRVVINLGVTLLGTLYVGGLGAFAAMLLALPNGVGLLLAAVIPTVGYDVGGFIVGANAGRAPLTDISPNKTVEGLIGGMVTAVLAAVVVVGMIGIAPYDDFGRALKLGIVVAIAAPLGDLCESLLKRDLGVKDMGDILPGHGGLLDRFDALLFVLPAVFYLSRIVIFT